MKRKIRISRKAYKILFGHEPEKQVKPLTFFEKIRQMTSDVSPPPTTPSEIVNHVAGGTCLLLSLLTFLGGWTSIAGGMLFAGLFSVAAQVAADSTKRKP